MYLKVGVTRLVLDMLEAGWGRFHLVLADPVEAVKAVSRDLTCGQAVIALEGHRRHVSAIAVQELFLQQAAEVPRRKRGNAGAGGGLVRMAAGAG